MIRDENQSDSIFNKENDFALVMASICIAKRLSNDPLSNQIVVQAIERASSLSEPAFLETVRSLVEEEDSYNRDDQNEKDSNDYSMDEEMIDDKLLEAEEDDENGSEDESEDEDDADYETKEENLLDLEDRTDNE